MQFDATLAGMSDGLMVVDSELKLVLWNARFSDVTGVAASILAPGLPLEAMLAALREFRGLPHRMEYIATVNGVGWYDDSKGTNVGATLAAVSGLSGPLVLIAGGDGKNQDFQPLADGLPGKARAVVLLGKDAVAIERAIAGRVPLRQVKDMDAAVQTAAKLAQAGDVALLSPACSSLDMFDNFEHRGRVFAAAVRRLADG